MLMKCDCNGWEKNRKLESGRDAYLQIHGMPWTGDIYKFCPWCGKELINVDDSDNGE